MGGAEERLMSLEFPPNLPDCRVCEQPRKLKSGSEGA